MHHFVIKIFFMTFKGSIPSHAFDHSIIDWFESESESCTNPQIRFQSHLSVCFRAELDLGSLIIQVSGFLYDNPKCNITDVPHDSTPGLPKGPWPTIRFQFRPSEGNNLCSPVPERFTASDLTVRMDQYIIQLNQVKTLKTEEWRLSCLHFSIYESFSHCPHYIYLITW